MDVVAVIGLVVGLAGVALALRANSIAKQSRKHAERANQLSAESRDLAAESKGLAVRANELSEEANTLSHRTEARETERNDVDWESDWPAPGRYVLTNRGQDEAIRVRATVDVDGDEQVIEADRVGPGGTLTLEFPGPLEKRRSRLREIRREEAAARNSPFPTFQPMRGMFVDWPYVWERITWQTPSGKHAVYEPKSFPSELGVPDPD